MASAILTGIIIVVIISIIFIMYMKTVAPLQYEELRMTIAKTFVKGQPTDPSTGRPLTGSQILALEQKERAKGKSNFAAYTINGTNPFSNGIITNGGTFTNTSMLF